MNDVKHTPPPWRVRDMDRHGRAIVAGEHYIGAQGLMREADARLMAAAPELLEALEWLRDCGECDEPEAQSVIREAIAKATGE